MVKVRCKEFGNCPCDLDDGQDYEIESVSAHRCTLREETGHCGLIEIKPNRSPGALLGKIPAPVRLAVLGSIGLAAIALVIYLLWPHTSRCDIAKADQMLRLAPQLGELEDLGGDCMQAGIRRGEVDALGRSVALLRMAAEKGSGPAALRLGQLYDPLHRPDLEKKAKDPGMLPLADPALAVHFYDIAAKAGNAAAADAAAALRRQFTGLPGANGASAGNPDMLPLRIPGYPDLFQRVIAKPGAMLASAPGGGGAPLAPLEILYVFARQPGWLRVGHNLQSGAEGWVAADATEPWQVTLAMRYAPPGDRRPVLFFKDDLAAATLLSQPDAAPQVDALVQSAQGSQPDPRLEAIEDRAVDWPHKPYVMPILKTRSVVTDGGATVNLVQVASVAGLDSGQPATPALGHVATAPPAAGGAGGSPSYCATQSLSPGDVRHAITFVIDTTNSMGPYIEQARQVAQSWEEAVARHGLADKVSFSVIAFRNNMDQEPQRSQLEYVTKMALPLTPSANAPQLAPTLAALSEAHVSTRSFDEDGVAGLRQALDQDWSPFCGARLVIYITDADVLGPDDPLAKYRGQGLHSIAAEARQRNIVILPVHLETPEARRVNDFERARTDYQTTIGQSSSTGRSTYRVIEGGSPQSFRAYLDSIRPLFDGFAQFGTLKAVPLPPPTSAAGVATPPIDRLLLGELFSVQQRFLGAAAGATAPTFSASWTSDRDLADPARSALEVVVLLTRRQLNQLGEQTQRLIVLARNAKLETSRFFALLRMTSAATAQDPARFGDDASRMGALLPSFLQLLPYKSDVLALTEEEWRSMGASRQDAFLRNLGEKISFYQKMEADQSQWHRLVRGGSSSGDGGNDPEAVAEVPLRELP